LTSERQRWLDDKNGWTTKMAGRQKWLDDKNGWTSDAWASYSCKDKEALSHDFCMQSQEILNLIFVVSTHTIGLQKHR
jgi:hypothetical protein